MFAGLARSYVLNQYIASFASDELEIFAKSLFIVLDTFEP
jgi:hypothetical protein